ncbi:UNVERIFIED_CONTAM: hypothetical protein Sradi_7205100 [Sesamum radiatum]|uniref:Uncharacterized protein n=1 Tax=Sesamum radiatum TaxID=300843 RepID=A0AAW2IPG5_SESRA
MMKLSSHKVLEDVWSIIHRMKELYAVPEWHIRYAMMKVFFGMIIIKGSSVREHGVMMISLVEKLKDLVSRMQMWFSSLIWPRPVIESVGSSSIRSCGGRVSHSAGLV